jgi:aryl-alcohol dehydrogenase-like predicted oxidoreductase
MGLLTGKYNAEGPFPGLRGKNFIKYDVSKLSSLLEELNRLSNKYNCKQTAVALNWCICKGTVPLGGAKTGEQVVQNAEALGGFCLSDQDIACLDKFSFIGSNNRSWQHG